MESTVISDAVNLASRLEGLTKWYGATLIISEQTLDGLSDSSSYRHRPLGKVQVKGKKESVRIFEVFEGNAEPLASLKLETLSLFEQGLQNYSAGEFQKAEAIFAEILQRHPQDLAARRYYDSSAYYSVKGRPENWQGVDIMEFK